MSAVSSPAPARPVVTPPGVLDLYTKAAFRRQLTAALAESASGDIVVDLGDVDFCDSSGLGCLIAAFKRANEQGARVYLLRVPAPILGLLARTGTMQLFRLIESLGELETAEAAGV